MPRRPGDLQVPVELADFLTRRQAIVAIGQRAESLIWREPLAIV